MVKAKGLLPFLSLGRYLKILLVRLSENLRVVILLVLLRVPAVSISKGCLLPLFTLM